MNPTKLLSNSLNITLNNIEEIETKCTICGEKINKAIQIKNVISNNFTNFEYFKYKTNYLCIDCAKCLKDDKLRKNNFIADKNKIFLFKQKELEKYIFEIDRYVEIPFIFAITRSFKKHNSFKCKLNYDYRYFFIQEEDKEYIFDAENMKKLYEILNDAYLCFTKDELLTGNYRFISIEQYGKEKFIKLETILNKYRGTHQFDLLIYMLDSERRNEYIKQKKEEKNNER